MLLAANGFGFTVAADEAVVPRSPDLIKGIEELGEEVLKDAKYLLTAPMRMEEKDAWLAGGAAVAIGGLFLVDDDIQDWFQRDRTGTRDDIARSLDTLGSFRNVLIVNLGLIGTGFWFRKDRAGDKLLRSALVSTEAQLFAEAISGLAKFAVGRDRPNEGEGKSSFDPFHEFDRSFPSSHAARAFAVAAVFADRYERSMPIIAYTAAALISLSSVYENDHFASDVLTGAVLGFAMGKALSRRHRRPDSNWTLLPFLTIDRKGAGLSFWCRF